MIHPDHQEVSGFLYADGHRLRNGEGRELLLRGVGLGSWLLPEGYMWRFPEQGDRPRRIEAMITGLIGADRAAEFWETYYDRYVAEADIVRIAEEGFNSVRIPINARYILREEEGESGWHEEHLVRLDQVIGWCREHRVYAILDLHGAPGGQTGTNIDDSAQDLPELFTDESNKQLTIAIWRMLAERYKDEWIVAGYDLLNEPLPDWFSQYNDQVMPLYREIITAIREVDARHMIILEGVHWATDWSIFEGLPGNELPDPNLMLQFHKYWNNPDTASIQKYLDAREKLNVPLFMGEGGENNKDWYTGAFRLFEDHGISWNFWTWKKLDTDNSPCSIILPQGWHKLVSYLEGGAKPERVEAQAILDEYLRNLSLDNCVYHADVVRSLFRRLPVRIPAIFYGYKGSGVSFGRAPGRLAPAGAGFREEDGMDFRFVEGDRTAPNFQHGRGQSWLPEERLCVVLAEGDWAAYEFTATDRDSQGDAERLSLLDRPEPQDPRGLEDRQGLEDWREPQGAQDSEDTQGMVDSQVLQEAKTSLALELRVLMSGVDSELMVKLDGQEVGRVHGAASDSGQNWQTVGIQSGQQLEAGTHELTVSAAAGAVAIEWLDLR
ncbi:cellulase family glycosylhydrolase [Paenibacillus borealis]|uniref:cellulase family glycosylhydrolase n=1 Tax=Paenibacillus borealis TaxID=160799 RepID=UPI000694D7EF|nr:cellulase family glycosylhydrolase [Paenibacillus borealis]